MRKSKFTMVLLILAALLTAFISTRSTAEVATQQQQSAPRKYMIKPLNLGTNTEIRARSTRNLQVQVTDENDRPMPDVPLLFLLSGIGSGSSVAGTFAGQTVGSVTGAVAGQAAGSVTGAVAGQTVSSAGALAGQTGGSAAQALAGQTSLRAVTNPYGIANANFTATDAVGSSMRLQIRVEGADAVWQGDLSVARAEAIFEPSQNAAPLDSAVPLPTLDAEEKACLALINQFRADNLQPSVKVSVKLTNAAKWLSLDNAENKPDDPDHTDSLGRDAGKRLSDFGYAADIIKENIVVGAQTAAQAMQVWTASGFHIRNLVNAEVKVMGVSRVCKKGAKLGCHWTVILGSTED